MILLFLFLNSINLFSQPLNPTWVKTIPLSDSRDLDLQGDYLYLAGETGIGQLEFHGLTKEELEELGGGIIAFSKYNVKTREKLWTKFIKDVHCLQGVVTGDSKENCYAVANTKIFYENKERTNITVLKYSPSGALKWRKSFGSEDHTFAYDVKVFKDSLIYISGVSSSDSLASILIDNGIGLEKSFAFVIALDTAGNYVKGGLFGGNSLEVINDIHFDERGWVYFAGFAHSTNLKGSEKIDDLDKNCLVGAFNDKMELQWYDTWGRGNDHEYYNFVSVDNDNNSLYVSGVTWDPDSSMVTLPYGPVIEEGWRGNRGVMFSKYDLEGNELWSRFTSKRLARDVLYSGVKNGELELIVNLWNTPGVIDSSQWDIINGYRFGLIKYDINGKEISSNVYGYTDGNGEYLTQKNDDDFVFVSAFSTGLDGDGNEPPFVDLSDGAAYVQIGSFEPNATIIKSINRNELCSGEDIRVDFEINFKADSNLVFYLELSDENGLFDNPVVIGAETAKFPTNISGHIPENTPTSKNYKIKVKSEDYIIPLESDQNLTIQQTPSSDLLSGSLNICQGELVQYVCEDNYINKWYVQGGEIIGNKESNTITIQWGYSDSGLIRLTQSDSSLICSNRKDHNVNLIHQEQITGIDNYQLCANSEPLALEPFPSGGSYTGEIIANGKIDPSKSDPGFYYCTYEIGENCISSLTFTVLILDPLPVPEIKRRGDTLYVESDLTAIWYNSNEDDIHIGNEFIVLENGIYYATLTDFECESDPSEMINVITSIEDDNDQLVLYPNPGTDQINISIPFKEIYLYDLKGRQLPIEFINQRSINISSLNKGIYYFWIDGNTYSFIKK